MSKARLAQLVTAIVFISSMPQFATGARPASWDSTISLNADSDKPEAVLATQPIRADGYAPAFVQDQLSAALVQIHRGARGRHHAKKRSTAKRSKAELEHEAIYASFPPISSSALAQLAEDPAMPKGTTAIQEAVDDSTDAVVKSVMQEKLEEDMEKKEVKALSEALTGEKPKTETKPEPQGAKQPQGDTTPAKEETDTTPAKEETKPEDGRPATVDNGVDDQDHIDEKEVKEAEKETEEQAKAEIKLEEKEEEEADKFCNETKPGAGKPCVMSYEDKVWLQVGWIIMFVGGCFVIWLYATLNHLIKQPVAAKEKKVSGDQEEAPQPTGAAPQEGEEGAASQPVGDDVRESMSYQLLWGPSMAPLGIALDVTIIGLCFANFWTFSVWTEVEQDPDYFFLYKFDVTKVNKYLEIFTLGLFTLITIWRLVAIMEHPAWKQFGFTAPLRYLIGDVYMTVEVFALIITAFTSEQVNFLWLFVVRGFEMLSRRGKGAGMKTLSTMFYDDARTLVTAGTIGLVIWVVMSGWYFLANNTNTEEEATWGAAKYMYPNATEPQPWRRFESIPSSMWYVLINLVKEHPLADAFTTFWQRAAVTCVCIFAMPLFALPQSILQAALFDNETEEEVIEPEEPCPTELEDSPPPSFFGTAFLVFTSIIAFFWYTARNSDHATFMTVPLKVSPVALAAIDGIVSIFFCAEWLSWTIQHGLIYKYALVDLVAWVPGAYHIGLLIQSELTRKEADTSTANVLKGNFGADFGPVNEYLAAACVLRILKLERFLHSFRDMSSICYENRAVLSATLMVSIILWMLFSTLIALTEIHSPDEEMVENFGTNMRSLWAEVINLHGEWPWADYTAAGKAVGTFIALFAILLFCIPISIFANSFITKVSKSSDSITIADRRPWQASCRPRDHSFQRVIFEAFYAHLPAPDGVIRWKPWYFHLLRTFIVLMVTLVTVVTIVATLEPGDLRFIDIQSFNDNGYVVDQIAVVVFALELFLRTIATGLGHPCSFVGFCDMMSLVAIAASLDKSFRYKAFHPKYAAGQFDFATGFGECIVMFRLLRLFSLEPYLGGLNAVSKVVYINRNPLARAGGAMVTIWFIHATLLYLFEREGSYFVEMKKKEDEQGEGAALLQMANITSGSLLQKLRLQEGPVDEDEASEVEMTFRYRSVLSALQYSIVHLFGDFPETDYTFPSKVLHFFGIMGGIAILATFAGVFSMGFVRYNEQERSVERSCSAMRRYIVVRRCVKKLQSNFRRRKALRDANGAQAVEAENDERARARWLTRVSRSCVLCSTTWGTYLMYFFNVALLANVLITLIGTLPELDVRSNQAYDDALLATEIGFTVVFFIEYIIRISARPMYVTTGWGVFDLLCLFPGIVHLAISKSFDESVQAKNILESLAIMRIVRVLHFPYFANDFNLISRALMDAFYSLGGPFYLAIVFWITSSCLFMWLENNYKGEGGDAEHMTSLPETMYWTSIFLTGEWADVDFTFAGSRLCIMYVIFGIMIFSLPVGIIVESLQNAIQNARLEKQDQAKLLDGHSVTEDIRRKKEEERAKKAAAAAAAASAAPEDAKAEGKPDEP